MTPSILLIAGPTASGKTALALALAEAFGGEIINADSMQVYRDLRVLTARPTPEEEARAPHRLFGHVDAGLAYSVGAWAGEALTAVEHALKRGRRAILVGGTGLYLHALTHGLAAIPDPGPDARARAQDLLAREGLEGLRRAAEAADPQAAAQVRGEDRQRLLRIVAVAEGLNAPLSAFWRGTRAPLAAGSWAGIALAPERAALHAAIEARARAMLAGGAKEEAAALLARGLDPELPAMKALGVSVLRDLLAGAVDEAGAVERLARDTRRYAKRQLTWMRGRMADWPRLPAPDAIAARRLWEQAGEG
ncbi:MAG: tRNA (adenosine(37)-N6)-dimethylallyltransferase MiaA [Caulobacterales bacterium]|nr:tRNA (adenosine(37)-N6)-dimethylallyltransferase MiaA [Caulobacterales bacterium]